MYPLHHFGWADTRAMRVGRYKVYDAPRPELYDLERDPGETANVYAERRSLADQMLARLQQMHARFVTPAPQDGPAPDVDPDVRARLAALGYVGSFVATSASPRTQRADPKDKIQLFNLMNAAQELSKEQEDSFDAVMGMLRKVTAEDAAVIDAWFMMGNQCFKAAKWEEAVGYFRKALALKPDYDLALINMANSYRALGRDDAALVGYEQYLRVDPKNAYVRYQMGEIYMDRGDLATAERQFQEALRIDERVAPARNALGVVAIRRGDLQAAEREIRAAIALQPEVALAHFNLALVAEGREEWGQAEAEYRRELELHPNAAYRAAFNLGRLYERLGDSVRQRQALQQSVEANPQFPEGWFYLAKAQLDTGDLEAAVAAAKKGLEVGPRSGEAALGHFVLGDVYAKRGNLSEAARELAAGRALEAGKRN